MIDSTDALCVLSFAETIEIERRIIYTACVSFSEVSYVFKCSPQLSGSNPEIKKLRDLDCSSGCSGYFVMNMSIF